MKGSDFRFWQMSAGLYTRMQEDKNKELYDRVIELSSPYIRKRKVLEIACGTGQFSFPLSKYSKEWIASDYSSRMIEAARSRFNQTKVQFCVEDACHLSFEQESFDVVMMANALHIIYDADKAVKEVKRVLKKNGVFIVPTFVYDRIDDCFRLKGMRLLGFKTYHKWKMKDLTDFLREHGFEIIESQLLHADLLSEAFVVAKKK